MCFEARYAVTTGIPLDHLCNETILSAAIAEGIVPAESTVCSQRCLRERVNR
jgi:hypothetical protein